MLFGYPVVRVAQRYGQPSPTGRKADFPPAWLAYLFQWGAWGGRKMDGQDDASYSGWEAGQEITSEEEYQRATHWLANQLLKECTPEHLAVIAAQHMIYVDSLKASNDSLIAANESLSRSQGVALQLAQVKSEVMEELRKDLVPFGTYVAKLVVAGYQKHLKIPRSEGGKARHRETNASKAEALKDWEANQANYSSRSAFARTNCRKYNVTDETLKRWIADYEKAKRHQSAS